MVETNHDMCYARSKDGGMTWERSDGTPYSLPITAASSEYAWHIPQNSELINQTSMTADSQSHPYIVTYWRNQDSQVPQYRILWNDGAAWKQKEISQRTSEFSLSGGGTKMIPISRPRVVAEGDYIAVIFRDEERGSKVSVAYTEQGPTGDWHVADLTDFSVNAWEPSLDPQLWQQHNKLHLFVQDTRQGDGEKVVSTAPTTVYVLEVKSDTH